MKNYIKLRRKSISRAMKGEIDHITSKVGCQCRDSNCALHGDAICSRHVRHVLDGKHYIVVVAGTVAQAIARAILESLGVPAKVQTQHRVRSATCTKEHAIGSKTNSWQSATSVL